jgi:ABC-type bacteriocin/lantibiotic exporters, contain an N-terminal double-glycine peptidase domain
MMIMSGSRPIRRRHRVAWGAASRRLARAQSIAGLWQIGGQLVFALGYAAGLLLAIRTVIDGVGSTGDVMLAIVLAAQVNQQVASGVTLFQQIQRSGRALARLHRVRAAIEGGSPRGRGPAPEVLRTGIELQNIAFRYHGADRPALRDVNLRLPAGTTVAIVGENGAGKSTLVKLLSKFYLPTGGRITIDGVDLARVPADGWRSRLAGAYQDFYRFELQARRNVGVGDLPQADHEPAVAGAIDRAGADDVVDALPRGLDTQLGKAWPDGVDVSFGQWQKLALARGFMRAEPLVLVLDEPTAALDAETEHALFERYAAGARRDNPTGRITVLVSHRFSTARMADLIVVLDGSHVSEVGSHDELLAHGGQYAELYSIQAAAYR